MRALMIAVTAVALAAMPTVSAFADVTYTFTNRSGQASFTYISPDLITSDRTVLDSELAASTLAGNIRFFPACSSPQLACDSIFVPNNGGESVLVGFDFVDGAFASYGQYTSVGGLDSAVLTISATPVPEPASLALLAAGLIGAGVIHRRRAA